MYKWPTLLLLLLGCFSVPVVGDGTKPSLPSPAGYVDDLAKVIDADSKQRLEALCAELDRKTQSTIVVVTIQSLGGASVEDYALSLFDGRRIGHEEDDRGILILLSVSDHEGRIEVGRGFRTLSKERASQVFTGMIPDLKAQRYGQGLLHCARDLASIVAEERHAKLQSLTDDRH